MAERLQGAFFTSIGSNDVVLGRGAPVIKFVGNVRFRELVASRKVEYMGTGRHQHKQEISTQVFEEVARRNGKFIQKIESDTERARLGVPNGVKAWVTTDNATAMRKVKQALREAGAKNAEPPIHERGHVVFESPGQQGLCSPVDHRDKVLGNAPAGVSLREGSRSVHPHDFDSIILEQEGILWQHQLLLQQESESQACRLRELQSAYLLPAEQTALSQQDRLFALQLEHAIQPQQSLARVMNDFSAQASPSQGSRQMLPGSANLGGHFERVNTVKRINEESQLAYELDLALREQAILRRLYSSRAQNADALSRFRANTACAVNHNAVACTPRRSSETSKNVAYGHAMILSSITSENWKRGGDISHGFKRPRLSQDA